MPHAFASIAFTPSVQAAQLREGSRDSYAQGFEFEGPTVSRELGDDEATFIAAQRSFYMATVSETGWPYVQHRGGPKGFLKVLDERSIAFADYAGNRQLVSVGNLSANDKVSIILMDYAHRVRLKIFGRARVHDFSDGDQLLQAHFESGYKAEPKRVVSITVDAFDWNCPQHVPLRIDFEHVEALLREQDSHIAALQAQLSAINPGGQNPGN